MLKTWLCFMYTLIKEKKQLFIVLNCLSFFFLPRNFFQAACDVPEPEEKFNIDEYSDMVTLSKPVIYISIEEIINTHSVSEYTFQETWAIWIVNNCNKLSLRKV